jgi:RNA polymerase sigma factor (sigma-70 family)
MPPISRERVSWLARNVLPHEPALRAWLGRRRVRGLDIDDIVQETYAALAELESVAHIQNPLTYTFAIAQSVVLQYVRHRRVVSIASVAELERLKFGADEISPERRISDQEELRLIADRIESLPEKCREAFVLRKVEGLSQREVAQRMAVSENTIEKHIGKALRLLMNVPTEPAGTVHRGRRTSDVVRTKE